MKICGRCKIEKSENEFYFRGGKEAKYLQYSCKICRADIQRRYAATHREQKAAYAKRVGPKYSNRNREFILLYLLEHPCIDCGESDPIVLHFDYIRDKKFQISSAVSKQFSIETIKKEIEKCEIRCANCHQRKTSKQQNWYKYNVNL